MSSPELFISRVHATTVKWVARGGEGEEEWGVGSAKGIAAIRGAGAKPAGAARGCEALRGREETPSRAADRGIGETRARRAAKGGEGGVLVEGGEWWRLKRGMKRQTAADEIHNLDPMRSLYLV